MVLNKLWGGLPTAETMAHAYKYPLFFANADHVLVISAEQPEGMVEMTDEFLPLLGDDDRLWLNAATDIILADEEKRFKTTYLEEQSRFLDRFEAELKKTKQELTQNA